ncbi:MAG: hypothetical protein QF541_12810, partial [Lentisphaeria bacterium]|nr:hypothetical protein [Lentisphaeria bacterium]
LGAAGVLEGLKATTHWLRLEALADYGAKPVAARFVEAGKVITAAGVSAGENPIGLSHRTTLPFCRSRLSGAG